MKKKDLVFYAVSALSLTLFMLLPLASGLADTGDFPGQALCRDWIMAGERFVASLR